MNALTGTACLFACVCLSLALVLRCALLGRKHHPSAVAVYCCSAFHSSIVQVRSWRESKPKGRSLVTDQSTPNTVSSFVRSCVSRQSSV